MSRSQSLRDEIGAATYQNNGPQFPGGEERATC